MTLHSKTQLTEASQNKLSIKYSKTMTALMVSCLLCACGQKGALYLPEKSSKPVQPTQSQFSQSSQQALQSSAMLDTNSSDALTK